jgi:hypothetical protein
MYSRPVLRLAAALALGATLAGCGKALPVEGQGRGATVAPTASGGASSGAVIASGIVTKNTSRLGGADPVADAAAVALAVHPGLTPATRPQAVVLVDRRRWPVALAAAALAAYPLQAPLLYSEGNALPEVSAQALATLRPTGAPALGGAQVIDVGTAAAPTGDRVRSPAPPGTPDGGAGESVYRLAAQLERLVARIHGGPPHQVIVVSATGPPALAMPAAGLAAETGAPILLVGAGGVPAPTRAALTALRRPTIYVVGPPAAVGHAVVRALTRYGPVRRIDAQTVGAGGASGPGAGGAGPVVNAIAVARFSVGSFGWGVDAPGHGLVFVNATRPLDAPAAAPLSASGDYGPLLLLEGPGAVPAALAKYLEDIQPSTPEDQPVRGFYNHGWVIGDERAITATTQAELDALLEAVPQRSTGPGASSSEAPEGASPETPSGGETASTGSPSGGETASTEAGAAASP